MWTFGRAPRPMPGLFTSSGFLWLSFLIWFGTWLSFPSACHLPDRVSPDAGYSWESPPFEPLRGRLSLPERVYTKSVCKVLQDGWSEARPTGGGEWRVAGGLSGMRPLNRWVSLRSTHPNESGGQSGAAAGRLRKDSAPGRGFTPHLPVAESCGSSPTPDSGVSGIRTGRAHTRRAGER